jgi:dolichyl-phosphate-mannose-protein mannosyltransferase
MEAGLAADPAGRPGVSSPPSPEGSSAAGAPGLRDRLVPPMTGSVFWGWAGPLLVTIFGSFLRFNRLGIPHAVVFDETYYAPDAYAILRHGVELNHVKNVNALLTRGNTHIFAGTGGEYVVHPPLGKIMIAVGEWMFGLTPFGWRFAAAVVGSLAILMTARIARRMTRSTLFGCVAGLLLALDGLEFVLSRTAILDIFVMFWVLAAFGLLVIDRDQTRARLAAAAAAASAEPDGTGGPSLGIRWPLVLAGVCLGCACASKWNGVWFIVAFAVLVVAWDLGARRAAGFEPRWTGLLRSDGPWLSIWFVVAPAAAYVASWTGWFATSYGYNRNGAALNGGHPTGTITAWLRYNQSMLNFGLGLHSSSPYQSNPLGWLVLARPTAFYSACLPKKLCGGATSTEQEVLAIGTPLIWWAACLALLVCLAWWLTRRDWRPGALLLCVAAGWLPWIWFYWHDHRTEFYFYSAAIVPFLVIAITLCLGLIAGPARASPVRRGAGSAICGAYLLAVLLNFYYIYPLLAGQVIPYSSWLSRMWFSSWI